jgi:hypothetical protein
MSNEIHIDEAGEIPGSAANIQLVKPAIEPFLHLIGGRTGVCGMNSRALLPQQGDAASEPLAG